MGDFQEIIINGKKYYKFSQNNKYYHKYIIKQYDILTTICAKYGYNSYTKTMEIYNDPANEAFRERFPDEDEIDYVNNVPFYIPVLKTEKQTINEYILNLVILTIIVNPPSEDPFTKYKLQEKVTVHYFLKYRADIYYNKNYDELQTSGKFDYNNESNLLHEIKISKQKYNLLSEIFIWIEPYGHGAIIDPADSDPLARGRISFSLPVTSRGIKIEVIEGVMIFIIDEAAINRKDPVIGEIQKLLSAAKSASTKKERKGEFLCRNVIRIIDIQWIKIICCKKNFILSY